MKIKGILIQGEVDWSFIKMCWTIDSMEIDQRWRLLECLKFLICINSFLSRIFYRITPSCCIIEILCFLIE